MADVNDVFNPNPDNIQLDLGLNDLVGEGKKYKDPDALAKAYANIEAHTRSVEAENARLRAEQDAKLSNNQNPNNGQEQSRQADQLNPTPSPEAPKPDAVDFRSQIREEVKALTEQERATANMEATAQRLIDTYGSPLEANRALQKRAQELGVNVEWLQDSAARSPAAFYATMGITGQSQSHSTPTSGGGVRIQDTSNVKNFEYFDKLRKDDPKAYFSAAVQREMMQNARTMGSDFYKR